MPASLRALAVALIAGVVLAVLPVAPALAAAPAVHVELLDPLMTDPAQVLVQAVDADGSATAFTGTIALAVGRTTTTASVRADADGTAVVTIPTSGLPAGAATMTARIRAGGSSRTLVLRRFLQVEPQLAVAGFGCAALPKAGGAVRWAVTRMAGDAIRTPDSRDVPLLPYVASSLRRWSMTDVDGLPLRTTGTAVLLSGSRVMARTALPGAVRKLVFSTRFRARLAPGSYTARLQLRDPAGRVAAATQAATIVASGTGPCSA